MNETEFYRVYDNFPRSRALFQLTKDLHFPDSDLWAGDVLFMCDGQDDGVNLYITSRSSGRTYFLVWPDESAYESGIEYGIPMSALDFLRYEEVKPRGYV